VAASLLAGLLAAALLVAAPFVPAEESAVTGAVLLGFALGWATLELGSARYTDHPQRWAFVPMLFMGIGGLVLLLLGSGVHEALQWVWPPAVLVLSVWMFVRVRRDVRSRSGRVLLYPVIAVLLLVSLAGGYETVRAELDENAYPPPGRLVDVGSHRLHLQCTGSGSPTVVLEPGAGMTSASTALVDEAVASETRVCVYDRAGRGWSEPADTRQDADRIATDLHTLLDRANVPGPYVLVGHSFGGHYVRAYAAHYPDEVAGMVLVDSTPPADEGGATTTGDEGSYDATGRVAALGSIAARVGIARLIGLTDYAELPPRSRAEARASVATPEHLRSTIEEYAEGSRSAREAAALTDLGDKPLVVLTAGVGSDAGWMADQRRMAQLSTNSSHRVVDGATHGGLVIEREPAEATSRAIVDVVRSVRDGQPLE
jgi:pimeloyl-ACP methyl ester carboxylesterase